MAGWTWRRRNYFINKDFQLRYIARIVFGMVVMALILGFTVYYTVWARIMDEFYTIPKIASQYAGLFASVTQLMGIFLLAFLVIATVLSVFASHSIAGPINRFEKSLQAIAQGDLTLRVGLRKTDEFKHVADTLNQMVSELRTNLSSDSELIGELVTISNRLPSSGKEEKMPASVAKDLEKLKTALSHLQDNVNRFKLGGRKV
jgi:methyl-accepting chemotaxis protein